MSITKETDSRSHQKQLRRLHAEVDALRHQLKEAQRLATVGTMAAMVAHEFNNILTPIINYAQLAQENPSLTAKALSRAADGGQRASSICNALLGFAGSSPMEPEWVDVEQLVRDTLSAMAREPQRDAIELTFVAERAVIVHTVRVELQQVLLNLLLNARAAVLEKPRRARIGITATDENGIVRIRVADNGVGIPKKNLERIFQPFFTTKATRGADGGSGLGLAVCLEILEKLGGQLDVESTENVGTTFTIELPPACPVQAGTAAEIA